MWSSVTTHPQQAFDVLSYFSHARNQRWASANSGQMSEAFLPLFLIAEELEELSTLPVPLSARCGRRTGAPLRAIIKRQPSACYHNPNGYFETVTPLSNALIPDYTHILLGIALSSSQKGSSRAEEQ
ncbi:hypothetical protein BV898_07501 [Hypsibius exemplaris]|uniref:Uncharacterized protein n=1 Tax=Hypsibius exemplaris TaxID=2072580 RepID=A0A1W0WTG3_HYPEX|nr:hypothetical protein BV898_07501 [Hypsibius exemplaris]